MYYIIEAMPMNSKHRPLYFTNRAGKEWLMPHVTDAIPYRNKPLAEAVVRAFNQKIDKHGKTFRVITIASSVVQRNRLGK